MENKIFWPFTAISISLFIFVFYLSWINRGSQQSYEILRPIAGGLIVALLFILGSLFSPLPINEFKTDIYLVTQKNGTIVPLEKWVSKDSRFEPAFGYSWICKENFVFLSGISEDERKSLQIIEKDKNSKYLLELVEWSTLSWIAHTYPLHWEVTGEWFEGISGGGIKLSVPKTAEKNITRVNLNKLLHTNRFANANTKIGYFVELVLPQNTKIVPYSEGDSHYIILANEHIIATIKFEPGIRGFIKNTDLAENILKKVGDDCWGEQITVTFRVLPRRWLRWSSLTQKQLSWIENLYKFYNKSFSWNNLKDKLEKTFEINNK